jgi:transposase InsO family protein
MDGSVDALEEAIERYCCPAIFNTDQGSQFTSDDFTSVLVGLRHRSVNAPLSEQCTLEFA